MHWRDWVDRFGPVLATHRTALSCLLPRVATTSLRFTMVFSDHRSSSDVSKESCKLRIATNKSTTTLAHTHTLSIRSGPGAEIVHFSVDKLVTVSVPCSHRHPRVCKVVGVTELASRIEVILTKTTLQCRSLLFEMLFPRSLLQGAGCQARSVRLSKLECSGLSRE